MYGRMSEEEKAPLSSQALVLGLGFYHRSQNDIRGTSLVVQWLRICLAMQGTQVQFLVTELKSRMLLSTSALSTEPTPQLESLFTMMKDLMCLN